MAGRLFVISASSGTGKTTLARQLLKEDKNLVQSISYTTRVPRPNEHNGEDYYFVTQKEFIELFKDSTNIISRTIINNNKFPVRYCLVAY